MIYNDTIRTLDADFDIQGGGISGKRPLHVILCVHGIRDDGSFATRLQAALGTKDPVLNRSTVRNKAGSVRVAGSFSDIDFAFVSVAPDDRISTLDFLCDARLETSVQQVTAKVADVIASYPGAAFSVLAHSFGTKLISLVLAGRQFDFEWIFLCASVAKRADVPALAGPQLPMSDRIPKIGGTRRRRVVNHACGRDPVPILAEMVRGDTYSATGVYGFHQAPVIERCFMHGHSAGIRTAHVKKWILKTIADDQTPPPIFKDWRGWKNLPTYARRSAIPMVATGRMIGRFFGLCRKKR